MLNKISTSIVLRENLMGRESCSDKDLVVPSVNERAARYRLLGSERVVTLRESQLWDVMPGEIVAVKPQGALLLSDRLMELAGEQMYSLHNIRGTDLSGPDTLEGRS